jgi:hypothetical protein
MKKIFLLLLSTIFLNACTQYVMGSAGPNAYHKIDINISGQTEDISKALCNGQTEKIELGGNIMQKIFIPMVTIFSLGFYRSKSIEAVCYVKSNAL